MALAIKSIPVLKSKVAAQFVRSATENALKKGSVDISAQVAKTTKILEKAKLK